MKLPQHLLRTYRRYKEEEQNLLLWIEGTADSIKSRKSRARTRASNRHPNAAYNSKNKSSESTASSTSNADTSLSILDIIGPVTAIAQTPKIVSIPANIVEQFRTVLQLRKACVDWFKNNTAQIDTDTRKRNERHSFPISILEEAISLLASKFPPSQNTQSVKSSGKQASQSPQFESNRFEHLAIKSHDRNQYSHNDNSTASRVSSPNLYKASKLTNEEILQNEFDIAKFCLLRDVQEIEDFMFLELVRYSLDQGNADVLPFLLNLAIDAVAKMESLLKESFDPQKFGSCFMVGIGPSKFKREHLSSPYLRMHRVLRIQCQMMLDLIPRVTTPAFNSHANYFGASDEQQLHTEVAFVQSLLIAHGNGRETRGIVTFDHIAESLNALLLHLVTKSSIPLIPAGTIFGIRMVLLSHLLLKDHPSVSLRTLFQVGMKTSKLTLDRDEFWRTSIYSTKRVRDSWPGYELHMTNPLRISPHFATSIQDEGVLLSTHHTVCMLNSCVFRLHHTHASIYALEAAGIVKILAHMWNLLKEEGMLDVAWPDMDFLINVLGVKFMFQSSRPTKEPGRPEAILYRMTYAMGFTRKVVTEVLEAGKRKDCLVVNLSFKPWYDSTQRPVTTFFLKRLYSPFSDVDGAVDAELVTISTVTPPIIGRNPMTVRFNQALQIENRSELWKLRSQGPGLDSTTMLAAAKKGLLNELRALDFGYLEFEQATLRLVQDITDALGIPDQSAEGASADLLDKLRQAVFRILENKDVSLLTRTASVFERWLQINGHVGVKGLCIAEQRPVDPRVKLSSLRPEVLDAVRSIVKLRGLRDDVFYADQLDAESIAVTETLEEIVCASWDQYKTTKKTSRLDSMYFVHPDLDLT